MRPGALVWGATAYFKRCAMPIDLKLGQALQFILVELATERIEHTIRTAHNKRFSEMAVGVEIESLLLRSTIVIAQVNAHPVRHFAKPRGVIRNEKLE